MRFLLLLLLPLLLAMTCGPPEAPSPDACAHPDGAEIQSLEIGARYESGFLPLANGASVPLVRGLQGADMIGIRLRLAGEALPHCLEQTSTLRTASGALLASVDVALHTYVDSDEVALRSTQTLWLAFDDTPSIGQVLSLQVRTSAGTEERSLRLVEEGALAIPTASFMSMAEGGSGVIELQLAEPAPPGGRSVMVRDESGSGLLARPGNFTIPEGSLRHSLGIELGETAKGGPIFVMDEAGQTTIDIDVGYLPAPGPDYPLLFNEVYAATEQGSADFNCDGAIDAEDSFVEIHNPNPSALSLQDLRIQQSNPDGDRLQYSFGDSSVGPGETILLMRKVGAPGCATEAAWPAPNLLPQAGQSLDLSASFGGTRDLVELPLVSAQASQVRSPEFSGGFTIHSSVSASGAIASPGFRANGEPFVDE